MKRLFGILALAAALLALPGCTLSIYNNYRDVESLRVVQALGIDAAGGGVRLSAATGEDASGREPLRLSCEGASVEGAMRTLGELAGAGSLFFSGTGAVILGEAAAEDAPRWLDAIARSRELRLDTELYILRGGEAAELLTGETAPEDVFAALDALSARLRATGGSPSPSCADVSRALAGTGAAAVTAIRLEDGGGGAVPVPAGLAVLTDGGLAGWVDGAGALGAGLFLGGPGLETLELGGGITVELAGAEIDLTPLFGADGGLRLDVFVSARASVIEAPPGSDFSSAAAWDELGLALAERLCGCVEAALSAASELRADFLGLGAELARRRPEEFAALAGGWPDALGEMDFSVSGEGKILSVREFAVSPYGEAAV